ncbi:MAG: hypothetical protein EOO61_17080 [Hymenobacter sp.]|nr:MAG: hypothetical protein EOO61_17080 [Hymenobacter sp.]
MKYFLLFFIITALFVWLAPKLFYGLGSVLSSAYVVVNGKTEIQGKISNHSANRGKYRLSLACRRETFDFDNFQNQALWIDGRLGSYLVDGDSVSKSANSPVLMLSRNGQLSQWTLVVPDPNP